MGWAALPPDVRKVSDFSRHCSSGSGGYAPAADFLNHATKVDIQRFTGGKPLPNWRLTKSNPWPFPPVQHAPGSGECNLLSHNTLSLKMEKTLDSSPSYR